MIYPNEHHRIPEVTMGALERYVLQGIPTGSFLEAVLSNDLFDAMARADACNMEALPAIVGYIAQRFPRGCYGTRETYVAWCEAARARMAVAP